MSRDTNQKIKPEDKLDLRGIFPKDDPKSLLKQAILNNAFKQQDLGLERL